MKKIFLVFGIAAYASASGQQKELFDIQQHLEKKKAESKKTVENKLLELPFQKRHTVTTLFNPNDQGYLLPNGDRVVIAGPGAMPVIKPDMRQFRVMPNPGLGNIPTTPMPNGALPRQRRILSN